jgi:hypothetical protein
MGIVVPVIHEASSDARNRIAAATSLGWPIRPSAWKASKVWSTFGASTPGALEDRIQEPVVLFLGHIGEGDRLKDARVINENVYAAEFPFRRLDQREAGRRFRDIATEDSHAIRLSEPGGCCAQLRFIPAVQQNSGAFGVQALGRLEADT